MPIHDNLNALPFVPLDCNVSSNWLSLIPMDIRSNYREISPSMGVYATGTFTGTNRAVAVTGMASCGGLILIVGSEYLAIHLGGDASSIKLYKEVIVNWRAQNTGHLIAAAASGPSGGEDSVVGVLQSKAEKYLQLQNGILDIYKGQGDIAVTRVGVVGVPPSSMTKPTRRKKGSCCIVM